jgi:tetratricopeptide (TPR) repeat protein
MRRQSSVSFASRLRPAAVLDRALKIAEDFGPLDFRLPWTLNAFGLNEYNLGNFAEAERIYRRATSIAERRNGSDARLLAGLATNMGLLYKGQGQHDGAEKYYRRALELMDREYGAGSVKSTRIRVDLASVYVWNNKPGRAIPLLKEGLAVLEKAPEMQIERALAWNHLGMALSGTGRHGEAVPMIEEALELMGKLVPANHPALIEGKVNLALVRIELEDFAEAEQLLLESMQAAIETRGPGDLLEAHIRAIYAGLLRETKRKNEARSMMKQADEIYEIRRSLRSRHSVDLEDLRPDR